MATPKLGALVLLGLIALGCTLTSPAMAKPDHNNDHGHSNGHDNDHGNSHHDDDDDQSEDNDYQSGDHHDDDDDVASPQVTREITYTLTAQRRTTLVGIVYGTSPNRNLIDDRLRRNILNDLDSLPPGIRRQYLNGGTLPPGIAKKYELPASVQPLIGLDPQAQVLVIGRDILVVNRSTQVILDVANSAL